VFQGRCSRASTGIRRCCLISGAVDSRTIRPATATTRPPHDSISRTQASVAEPALVLLDEPTAGMTIEEVRKTVQLMKQLNETATVIVVEHDMNFIRMIARRVTVMHQGEAFAEGSMEEIEANEAVRDIYLGKGAHRVVRR